MAPPYVVKPVAEGSSVGVHIVLEGANGPARAVLDERAIFGSHAMVERFVPGKELTCAVIGDGALGVIDIVSKSSELVRLHGQICARRLAAHPARGDPGGRLSQVPGLCAAGAPGAGLPRRVARRFPL